MSNTVTNREIKLYQEVTEKVSLQKVWDLLGMQPHSGQKPIVDDFDNAPTINNYVVVLGRRAQPLNSVIKSPNGDIKMSDIKIGDIIYNPDGGTQEVIDTIEYPEGEVYEITLSDGRKCRADSEHLWLTTEGLYNTLEVLGKTLVEPKGSLKTAQVVNLQYLHKEPVKCITVSGNSQTYITDDYIRTHNSGKSMSTSIIALRELLVPFSNTILITPSYKNSKIIFNDTLKLVKQLGLPIKAVNKNSFTVELDNGSTFGSFTSTNFEAALGSRASLIIFDETQSIPGVMDILNRILLPMLLDYGTRPNGTLYGRCVFLGTPRESGSEFHNLFLKEKQYKNWKSYNSPSMCNPILPRNYLEEQKKILPELVYRNEILAEFVSTGVGVFYAFDPEVNLYDPTQLTLSGSKFVIGLDTGYSDQTAAVLVYVSNSGSYYVHAYYQKSMTTTENHIKAFRELESVNAGILVDRFLDPSSAQAAHDWLATYDYATTKAFNKVDAGLNILNNLMAPQGYDRKPKLFINKNLAEVIRQITLVTYREDVNKNNPDPFVKDPEGTHWDLIAAIRYAIASHYRREAAGLVIV